MQKSRELLISPDSTILDALLQLNKTARRLLICVDREDKLIGVLTDGDIRRCLLKGHDVQAKVEIVVNRNPFVLTDQASIENVLELLSDKSLIIPIVNNENTFVGFHDASSAMNMRNIRDKAVSIVGMGYVGLTLALVLAENGFRVNGYDIDNSLINKLNQAEPPFFEDGLAALLEEHTNRWLKFTNGIECARGEIYIITVGTPIDKNTTLPNLANLRSAAHTVGKLLKQGDLVLLRSTVPVGCTRHDVLPILEAESSLKAGDDFYVAYAPERTIEGAAIKELSTNPQIIGGHTQHAFELAARLFNAITPTAINVKSLEAAELAKLMDNTYRDHIFAYSNMMAHFAEKVGVNYHELIKAVNNGYPRHQIPKPSPGVGGPCLSKDPYILKSVMESQDCPTDVVSATRATNEIVPERMVNKLATLLNKVGKDITTAKISLIGMAFKGEPETSDLRDSTSLAFLELLPHKSNIFAYDPVIDNEAIAALGVQAVSLGDAFHGRDAIVILNNHKSYAKWPMKSLLTKLNKPAVLLDGWYIFNPAQLRKFHHNIVVGGIGYD